MDLSELKGIVSIMQKSDLTELEIELKDLKLRMARPGAGAVMQREVVVQSQPSAIGVPTQAAPTSATPSPSAKSDDSKSFPSPMVGTFYRRPSPEDPEFVKVGDKVKKGDVLCIIEAMKVMNEIQSDFSGEIVETLIEDGVSVEFGQPLFKIRPA
ncbi:MAG: acetyl-CoA carboxylase biotin carboxyl carrier protein [Opitutales bacterium]|nr:acetyl-CoA carboxylase biotin carboxyl carrier protein [Verrucomicrobiota bacterium]NDH15496.1 acetyl-CoA carboxylase biotin carboxyl carrier protein [Opitutae bacterium]